jgi:hypothetical protein
VYLCRGKRTKIEEYFGGIYVYHFTYPYITCGGKSGTSKVGPLKKGHNARQVKAATNSWNSSGLSRPDVRHVDEELRKKIGWR